MKTCSFIQKRFQNRCFPVNFAKFLRKIILQNIYERLFLEKEKTVFLFCVKILSMDIRRKMSMEIAWEKVIEGLDFTEEGDIILQ